MSAGPVDSCVRCVFSTLSKKRIFLAWGLLFLLEFFIGDLFIFLSHTYHLGGDDGKSFSQLGRVRFLIQQGKHSVCCELRSNKVRKE